MKLSKNNLRYHLFWGAGEASNADGDGSEGVTRTPDLAIMSLTSIFFNFDLHSFERSVFIGISLKAYQNSKKCLT